MEQQFKILMLGGSPGDIKLIGKVLKNAGFYFDPQIVATKSSFENALQSSIPDIFLAEGSLSGFDPAEALKIYIRKGLTQPFILYTEKDSIESAVDFIKKGGWDYILKDRIEQLPASIMAGLEAHKIKSKKIVVRNSLKKRRLRYQKVVKRIMDGISTIGEVPADHLPAENKEKKNKPTLQKLEFLLANGKLMNSTENLAHLGSWEVNLLTNEIHCTDEMFRIYGYEPLQCKPSLELFLRHVSPADLPDIQNHLTLAKDPLFQKQDYRIIDSYGKLKYIHAEYRTERDAMGIPVKVTGFNIDVTEKKIADLQLIERCSYYPAMIENAKESFLITDENGDILDTNNAASEIFEYTREEFSTLNWTKVLENNDPTFLLSTQYLKNTGNTKGEITGIKKSGKRFLLEFTSAVFSGTDGKERISFLMNDITTRKEQEETFIKNNERFTHVSKATFNAIWDWDVKTKELYFGDGYKELFGYDITNGTFFTWADNIHPQDKDRVVRSRLNKIIRDDVFSWTDEYRYIRADGSIAYVLDRGVLLKDTTITYRMIGAMQDVTELKNKEISIRQLNNVLEIKAKELAASNEELERFAYVASHDLQEPLRMINGFLQLLSKNYSHQLDETAQHYISYAVDGSVRMKTLIFDLLEYSRIGSYKKGHTIIDLNEVLSKALKDLQSSTVEAQALISVPMLPQVWGNEFQLTRLFQNLISNALKYRAAAVRPEVEVGFSEREATWEFFVKDNGIGIQPKYFKKIFIIFQRLHGRNEYKGTGIGLAICKKIVELHGGKIWVESSGKGSEFRFTISKVQIPAAISPEIISAAVLGNDANVAGTAV